MRQCARHPGRRHSMEDLKALFEGAMEHFGGKVDFRIALHRWHVPQRPQGQALHRANYSYLDKTFDVSAISLHKTLQTAMELDAINEWEVVGLSYIAAQRTFPDYGDMADAKSLLESIARSFGYHYGTQKKVRINTIGQSPTVTTAGSGVKGFDEFIAYSEARGNATGQACAGLLRHPVQRPHPLCHHAEPLPRRRLLQHRRQHGGHLKICEGRGLIGVCAVIFIRKTATSR